MPMQGAWSSAMRTATNHNGTQHAVELPHGGSKISSPILDQQKRDIQANVDEARRLSDERAQDIMAANARDRAQAGGDAARAASVAQSQAARGGYPTSGTWESPKGSLLTQVEKVDRGLLGRMYQAETSGSGLGELMQNADAKTRNAFNLGYMNPRV